LIEYYLGRGQRPALVTRGYRGSWERRGGVLSDGKNVFGGFREAGDEPVMISRRYPAAGVFVGRRRVPSCLRAESLGFDICVLDDAFQHLGLARDLDIVLHDPESLLPLREGESALARASILLLPRRGGLDQAESFRRRFPRLKIFEYAVVPRELVPGDGRPGGSPEALRGKRVFAFAGIARPGRFFDLLEALGASVVGRMEFPDHYAYPRAARARLAAAVSQIGPEMVLTTEKDAVKFESADRMFGGPPVVVLRIGLDLPAGFYEYLEASVSAVKAGHV
jgi:tetraacyldisaccharide 4'-kinase